jgi:microcystin-dependent protein
MSDQFIGEIRIFASNFPPTGWAFCDGQLLPLTSNTALFSLLGTTYGGNGINNFALPNLNGRAPLHPGDGPGLTPRSLGQSEGSAAHALTVAEMPPHSHSMRASSGAATTTVANGNVLANVTAPNPPYHDATMLAPMAPGVLGTNGSGTPHENRQPFLTLSFMIALQGIFPPRA